MGIGHVSLALAGHPLGLTQFPVQCSSSPWQPLSPCDDVITPCAVPTDPADRAPRTLYCAHGWSEVEAFLFGSPQRFNLYRSTAAVETLSTPQASDDHTYSLNASAPRNHML